MKVKYKQLYSNDCGVSAIKNLLVLHDINLKDLDVKTIKEGVSLLEVSKVLKKYFYDVNIVSFEIREIKKVKHFTPYIAIIENKDFSHYVVIYKKDKKYLYVLDSMFNKSYKITYENFSKIDGKKAIIVENKKQICSVKSLNKITWCIPILSIVESVFLLSSTVILQQIIDNGFKDALLYIIVQLMLLAITTYKIKVFLKTFSSIDNQLILKINQGVFNLKDCYYSKYETNEIFYRTFDAYSFKSMYMNFIFNIISDVILFVAAYLLIIIYSYILAIVLIPCLLIAIFLSIKIYNKTRIIIEEKRKSEYEFISFYKDCFTDKKYIDESIKNRSIKLLKDYQEKDYRLEKLNVYKRLIFVYFQSVIISILVILYFTKLYTFLSVGSLVALINLVTLLLQPMLNICSEISALSNYKLIKDRLNDINNNIK